MKKNYNPQEIDVLILCGGKGERLKDVIKDQPKPMAEIGGRSFLEILIDNVANYGFQRFILCAGYKGEIIKEHFKNRYSSLDILISLEKKPLGTAGAVKNTEPMLKSNPFLVMNGDSFCSLDFLKFINFHRNKKATFSVVLVRAKGTQDYGIVKVDDSKRIISFDEKSKKGSSDFINGGIYLFEKSIFHFIASGKKVSLEYDIFPKIVKEKLYGYITEKELIDIGTPDRYAKAEENLRDIV